MLKKEYNIHKKYTDYQLYQLYTLWDEGKTFPQIAMTLNAKWGVDLTWQVYYGLIRRNNEEILQAIKDVKKEDPNFDLDLNKKHFRPVRAKAKKKRYLVGAVEPGAAVDPDRLAAIENYVHDRKAKVILIPGRAHVKPLHTQPNYFDPILRPYMKQMHQEFAFNDRLKALDLNIRPQQINPLTGLGRIRGRTDLLDVSDYNQLVRPRNQSLLVPSPKQMLKHFTTGNATPKRMIGSFGYLTDPNYRLVERVGRIAAEDHQLGAAVVEIDGDVFHIRYLQINPIDNSIVDYTPDGLLRYYPDGNIEKERAKGLVVGDLHPGHDNYVALDWYAKLCEILDPENIYLHDWLDAAFWNPHQLRRYLTRALNRNFTSMKNEIEYCRDLMQDKIIGPAPKDSVIVPVPSNHPDFVKRYLDTGAYVKTDVTDDYWMGHEMVLEYRDGIEPLQKRLDPDRRLKWTTTEEDVFCEGIQCNVHGHLGPNGSRGNTRNQEASYGSGMGGHTHMVEILHEWWNVGHMSAQRHGYNIGASGWTIANGIIARGGHRQILSLINGKDTIG